MMLGVREETGRFDDVWSSDDFDCPDIDPASSLENSDVCGGLTSLDGFDLDLLEADQDDKHDEVREYDPLIKTNYDEASTECRGPGKERDDSTGLYYYGQRYYAPWLGRWMSADPAGPVDGLNLYEYVSGNPVRMVDAQGRQSEDFDSWINSIETPTKEESDKQFDEMVASSNGSKAPVLVPATETIQKRTGISPTGKHGKATAVAVSEYQKMLQRHGYYSGEISGKWDLKTEESFQKLIRTEVGRGAARIWSQLGKLESLFDPSEGASREEFSAEVFRIKQALVNTWIENYEDFNAGDLVGGHFCWDWARGFAESVQSMKLEHFSVDIRKAETTETGSGVHYYTELHAYGRTNLAASTVAVDDAFIKVGKFVHSVPFPEGPWAPAEGQATGYLYPVSPVDDRGRVMKPQKKYPPVTMPRYTDIDPLGTLPK